MQGLDLAEAYFQEFGAAMIDERFSPYKEYIAAGLVGEGSECFGFDDGFSRDHDFGPGFCIWLPEEIYREIGTEMQAAYEQLPKSFCGYTRNETLQGGGRVGVMSIEGFYGKFIGTGGIPETNRQWFTIPERYLAMAVNGRVFCDYLGTFSRIRERLKAFYPEDVRKKKIANRAALMAQSGQYNYPRCMKRGDEAAAYLACSEFVKNTLSCLHLINRKYTPFYKWAFRSGETLSELKNVVKLLKELILLPDEPENSGRKELLIEDICLEIQLYFRENGMTATKSTFLLDHGEELMGTIEDDWLRKLHIMTDV